jgi:molecular chaperone DnaK (HSP70)
VRLPAARPGEPPPEAVKRTPARRYVIATDAVRRAIAQGGKVTVTVVPVTSGSATGGELHTPGGPRNPGDPGEHLRVDRAAIVFYN